MHATPDGRHAARVILGQADTGEAMQPSARDVHRHEAPELSGFWVPLKVIDDPDGDGRVLKAGCAKRFDQSACQGVSIDADNCERLEVYAFGRLPDPVVEDLGCADQDGAHDVGMDVHALVAEHIVGAAANPGAQVAVVCGVWLLHEAVGQLVADERLS